MNRGCCLALVSTLLAIQGCGNLNSVYRNHSFSGDDSALIDIKQRAILTNVVGANRVVCAEPSPDAMASYAGELAAKVGKTPAQISAAQQEAATFVGMRTQTIQVLRDQMFRLCEARMNGAISDVEYQMLLTRNQRYTVALLAIEQLSGVRQVPVVSLTQTGTASITGSIDAATKRLKEAQAEKADIESQITAATPATAEQTQKLAALAVEMAELNKLIAAGSNLLTSGSSVAKAETTVNAAGSPMTNSTDAVKEIALKIFEQTDEAYVCFNTMTRFATEATVVDSMLAARTTIIEYCNSVLQPGTVIKAAPKPAPVKL
ncbi:hypothetical protein AXG94_02140 [Pseudomonas corrugata]|nr:hypothetical protein AXG94_02140 [Pseudomonas corrugata]